MVRAGDLIARVETESTLGSTRGLMPDGPWCQTLAT